MISLTKSVPSNFKQKVQMDYKSKQGIEEVKQDAHDQLAQAEAGIDKEVTYDMSEDITQSRQKAGK